MKRLLTLAALPLILAACGGGSGGGDDGLVPQDDSLPDTPLGFRLVNAYSFPGDADCSTSMAGITSLLGYAPEERYPATGSYYDAATGESEVIWYYWSRGEGVDWVWENGDCRAVVFAFTPIFS